MRRVVVAGDLAVGHGVVRGAEAKRGLEAGPGRALRDPRQAARRGVRVRPPLQPEWLIERHGYRSPLEAREHLLALMQNRAQLFAEVSESWAGADDEIGVSGRSRGARPQVKRT